MSVAPIPLFTCLSRCVPENFGQQGLGICTYLISASLDPQEPRGNEGFSRVHVVRLSCSKPSFRRNNTSNQYPSQSSNRSFSPIRKAFANFTNVLADGFRLPRSRSAR